MQGQERLWPDECGQTKVRVWLDWPDLGTQAPAPAMTMKDLPAALRPREAARPRRGLAARRGTASRCSCAPGPGHQRAAPGRAAAGALRRRRGPAQRGGRRDRERQGPRAGLSGPNSPQVSNSPPLDARRVAPAPVFDAPARVKEYLQLVLAHREHEVLRVLYLDAQHHLIEMEELFRGTLTPDQCLSARSGSNRRWRATPPR